MFGICFASWITYICSILFAKNLIHLLLIYGLRLLGTQSPMRFTDLVFRTVYTGWVSNSVFKAALSRITSNHSTTRKHFNNSSESFFSFSIKVFTLLWISKINPNTNMESLEKLALKIKGKSKGNYDKLPTQISCNKWSICGSNEKAFH